MSIADHSSAVHRFAQIDPTLSGYLLGDKAPGKQLVDHDNSTNAVVKGLDKNKFSMADQSVLSHPALTEMPESEANCLRQLSVDSASDILRPPFHHRHQRPRRCLTEGNIRPFPERQHSFRRDVQHAAAETYLITRLSFTLVSYLGVGYRWMTKLAALGLYALFLMPGFLQVGWYYFFSKLVERSVIYGEAPRNRLDLYVPENIENSKPVVVFVTGGAWIIGYKAWGSLLGKRLVERGVIVACIDYRNFPQGTIGDMVRDVSEGISFICKYICNYGGDPNRIYLVGQSAGAHIAACALVEQARKEKGGEKLEATWSLSQIKAFVGISGGYNLCKLVDHFHERGLYRSIFLSIMEGEDCLPQYSPEIVVQSSSFGDAASLLPPIYLYHGTADYSVPYHASTSFAEALLSVGVEVKTKLYRDKTHTDLFLQDPLRGGYDPLLADIVAAVDSDAESKANGTAAPPARRLVPEILLQLARKVSPF